MRPDQAPMIRLADYTPPAFLVDQVHLTIRLRRRATRVRARIQMRPNPEARPGQDLLLDGQDLSLNWARIDGRAISPVLGPETLRVPRALLPDGAFLWETETEIDPAANTALEGLYLSGGIYTTQCEAEGFRKITYYPDRPDVLARFRVRIEGDAPVLLSNGNPVGAGPGWAEWDDPWPKPSYLFALVAGDLVSVEDMFVTASGREVALKIWVRAGDEPRTGYAMDALKRSMRWDEARYGREYDLDLFQIVAIDDFNAGAMENKGLNIFNAKYVLASPETATDRDYALIEGIIAHEYFHNWTGNRVTCRDWFQLSLKEGLTVFRDQEFSAEARSAPVQRIQDVLALRARQFREDAGPLAHPVRPAEYVEINNFYTATVYEKGAEVIRMLHALVGAEAYRQALDLYFARHDGTAATIEDWLSVFEETTGRDLSQFKLWYSQAGTPRVAVEHAWDGEALALTLRQSLPPTPGQAEKAPMVIPLAVGLIGADGAEVRATEVIALTEGEAVVHLTPETPQDAAPVVSINRGFSAPIILDVPETPAERAFLSAHDTDPFNRWEAGRRFALDEGVAMAAEPERTADPAFLEAMAAVLADKALDPAFKALALALPSEEDLFQAARERGMPAEPDQVHAARDRLDTALAAHLPDLAARVAALSDAGPYTPDATAAGRRALKARLLGFLTRLDPSAAQAQALFAGADNMTDAMAALSLLVRAGAGKAPLAAFYDRWKDDALVIDKWFSVQAMMTPPDAAAETVARLADHPAFAWKTPNRFRALIGAFASGNMAGFHAANGVGYRLVTDWLLKLDPINPQTAARLAGVFESWRQFDERRQSAMLTQLQRIADTPKLSRDMAEIVGRILDAPAG